MHARGNRTFICSVLFLDIVGYSDKPVAEQIRLKEKFNALVGAALKDVAASDRIILDTGDGAAISFIGDPEDALAVAGALREGLAAESDSGAPLAVRLGINLGPVKLVRDINGQPNIIGDGINVAQRVMGFADPGQVLVSRSYFEVVSRISEGYAQLFEYVGVRTDKHVRAHEVFRLTAEPGSALPRTAEPAAEHEDVLEFRAQRAAEAAADALPRRSPRLYVTLPLAVAVILGSAVALRQWREAPPAVVDAPSTTEPAAAGARPAPAAPAPSPSPAPAVDAPIAAPPATPPVEPTPRAKTPRPAAPPARPGVVELAIAPWGEVYVDGRKAGVSPPLQRLELAPGSYLIEVRNRDLPAYRRTVQIESGESVRIRHKFR